MKRLCCLVLVFSTYFSYGQKEIVKKPEYVIIINDEIVTKEKVDEYAKQGYIKTIKKGVSDEERAELAKKFGDRIGDKEFIVIVSLNMEKEKWENKNNSISKKDSSQNDNEYILNVNDSARDFTVKMIDGKNIKLSDLRGKIVLLNFWATWCAPCLMEFYDIPTKILEPFKNKAFVFLPISKGESKEKVTEKMERLKRDGIRFPVAIDPEGTTSNLYGAGLIPKSVLIDKNGVIRYVSIGNAEGNIDKLVIEINKLLDK